MLKYERDGFLKSMQNSLATRLRAGDRLAATEFVDRYYERIYLFMRRLGFNQQVSEDLTQECFMRAWQRIAQLRDDKALNGWLYVIAGNLARSYWRRNKNREVDSLDGFDFPDVDLDKSEYKEELILVKTAVGRLSMKLRQAVVLHYMQHLTIAEAAEAIGIRQGTFKSRLSRALKVLRKQVISQNGELL